jgi:hypothetical protein
VCTDTKKSTTALGWRFARPEDEEQGGFEAVVSVKELRPRMRNSILVRKSAVPVISDRPVVVLDINSHKALRCYASVKEAAERLGIARSSILNVCIKKVNFKTCWHFGTRSRGDLRMRCRRRS